MGEKVSFASNGDTCEGYLALPVQGSEQGSEPGSEPGSGPGVVLIQEWWGLVDHIVDVAQRLAGAGFVVLAPDLYHGLAASEPDEAGKLMMGLAMDRAAKDIAGAAAYLRGRPETTGRGIGVIGFCMGGSLALWSATLSDDVVATVGYYPAVPWEKMSPTWERYDGKAALIHNSEEDGGADAAGVTAARAAIEQAGGTVAVHAYPGTSHAFFNDQRPEVHDPEATAMSWARTLDFLSARLGA